MSCKRNNITVGRGMFMSPPTPSPQQISTHILKKYSQYRMAKTVSEAKLQSSNQSCTWKTVLVYTTYAVTKALLLRSHYRAGDADWNLSKAGPLELDCDADLCLPCFVVHLRKYIYHCRWWLLLLSIF